MLFCLALVLIGCEPSKNSTNPDLTNLSYDIGENSVSITRCKIAASGSVAIPETIEGKPVTSIGFAAFYSCSSLTSVSIPNSVTSIVENAFDDCSGLTNIVVDPSSSSYASLDGVLFSKNLKAIVRFPGGRNGVYSIPNSVTSIGVRAFCSCGSLMNVTIPNSVTSIAKHAFDGCGSMTNVSIPNSVASIEGYSFPYCISLTDVSIPDSITNIGAETFFACSSLRSVSIPNSVTSIGPAAFYGCSSMTNATIPDSIVSIGGHAFHLCTKMTEVTFLGNAPRIGESAFPIDNSELVFKARKDATGFESGIQGRSVELD